MIIQGSAYARVDPSFVADLDQGVNTNRNRPWEFLIKREPCSVVVLDAPKFRVKELSLSS